MHEHYPYHTLDTAPEAVRPTLRTAIDTFGMLPNLTAKMATAPAVASDTFKPPSTTRAASPAPARQGPR